MLSLLLLVGAVFVVLHGAWWLRRVSVGRGGRWLALISVVLFGAMGLSFGVALIDRLTFALAGVGIALEMTAYNHWDGPLSRWIWKRVAANPRLEAELKTRGIEHHADDDTDD